MLTKEYIDVIRRKAYKNQEDLRLKELLMKEKSKEIEEFLVEFDKILNMSASKGLTSFQYTMPENDFTLLEYGVYVKHGSLSDYIIRHLESVDLDIKISCTLYEDRKNIPYIIVKI